ncbi:MAG: hypothetical protein JJ863_04940 [Deltaproteobacteria bacterium]|nr:hypothetical protein [Deltaproteobacteria bacterium]
MLRLRPTVMPVATPHSLVGVHCAGGTLVSLAHPTDGESVLQRHDLGTLEPLVLRAFARVSLSPSGDTLAVAALPEDDAPGFLALFATEDWSERARLEVESVMGSVSWADDARLVTGTIGQAEGALVEVWSPSLERTHSVTVTGPFAEVSAHGDLVAAAGEELHLWRVGSAVPFFHSSPDHPGSARYGYGTCGVVLDAERFAAHHFDRSPEDDESDIVTIRSFEDPLATGVAMMGPPAVYELAASPSGDRLALRLVTEPDEPTFVRVHDTRDGQLLATLDDTPVSHVAWVDDDTLVIAGGTLSAWRLER